MAGVPGQFRPRDRLAAADTWREAGACGCEQTDGAQLGGLQQQATRDPEPNPLTRPEPSPATEPSPRRVAAVSRQVRGASGGQRRGAAELQAGEETAGAPWAEDAASQQRVSPGSFPRDQGRDTVHTGGLNANARTRECPHGPGARGSGRHFNRECVCRPFFPARPRGTRPSVWLAVDPSVSSPGRIDALSGSGPGSWPLGDTEAPLATRPFPPLPRQLMRPVPGPDFGLLSRGTELPPERKG